MGCSTRLRGRLEAISRITAKNLFQSPANFIAFGFGTGLSPVAPGTMGSLLALPLIWLLREWSTLSYLALVLALLLAGIPICSKATKSLGVHDHPGIVWDEVVGMLLVVILVPVTLVTLVTGFILFRFFDIVKPWPIRYLDTRVHGGLGIMIDDVAAGIAAALVLWIVWSVSGVQ